MVARYPDGSTAVREVFDHEVVEGHREPRRAPLGGPAAAVPAPPGARTAEEAFDPVVPDLGADPWTRAHVPSLDPQFVQN